MSTVNEIELAIEKLSSDEQRKLAEWVNSRLIEETPEMLAALAAGERSLETEPTISIEEASRKIKTWTTSALCRGATSENSRGLSAHGIGPETHCVA